MRAKPIVTCGLLAGVLTLPIPALALGLGKLTVQSGLGQPLSAQIELTSAQRDELDSLRARIADPSVYRDNNVAYPGALSRARVTLEQSGNNPPYLRISTSQAVNDPYLDMIVEINWATGKVVRDYTFLLDPPGSDAQAQGQAVEPAAPIVALTAPGRAPRGSRSTEAAPTAPAVVDNGSGYTVKRGDSLSKIAKDYKPENASLDQMLVAIFRSNEGAFDGRNMNRLRTGQILSIPAADQIAAVTPTDASATVKLQASDWRAYRDRVAGNATTTDATTPRQAAGGRISTAVEDKGTTAKPGEGRLSVSRDTGKGSGVGSAQAEDADREGQGAARGQCARRRTRKDRTRPAAGRGAAQQDDGGSAGACRRSGQGQGSGNSQGRSSQGRASEDGRGESRAAEGRGDAAAGRRGTCPAARAGRRANPSANPGAGSQGTGNEGA